ncbi:hypothetical protein JCM21900_000764, partial [Sporobolomyces salmonicolor]
RFPDALSKTIPLWCATLNRARMHLLPPASDNSSVSVEEWDRQGQLFTSPQAVGPSEHAQIAAKIEAWAKDLATSSYDLTALKALDRPLRPFFVSPASTLTYSPASAFTSCYPIICASASKLAEEADGMERTRGFTYVQGSGDDHEAWSKGLTPRVFWEHADEILSASREDIDAVIARILNESSLPASLAATSLSPTAFTQIRATKIHLRFAADPSIDIPAGLSHITITVSKTAAVSVEMPTPKDLVARPGKAGYATFFAGLEPSLELATKAIKGGRGVAVTVARCESQSEANDLGVAVALILLVRLFDGNGQLLDAAQGTNFIRTRLQWILEAFPTVNPSRAVLNRVNEARDHWRPLLLIPLGLVIVFVNNIRVFHCVLDFMRANPLPCRSTSAHLGLALRDQKCRTPPEPAPLPPYYSAHTPRIRPSPLFRSPASKSLPPCPAQNAPIVSTSPAPAPPRGLLSGAEERWHSVTPDPFHCPQLADDELTSHRNAYLPHTHPRTRNILDIPTDLSKREFVPWTITRYKIVAMDPDEPDSLPNAYSLRAMHRADAGKVQRRMKRAKGKGKGKGKENETGKELLAKIDRWHDPYEPFWGEQSDDSSSDDEPAVGFGALAVPAIRTERERRRRRRAEGRPEEDDDGDESWG